MSAPTRNLSDIKYITIHHSAVVADYPNLETEASQFNSWHKSKSWAEDMKTDGKYPYISYHYLVNKKGEFIQTQDLKYQRYHAGDLARGATSHNLWGIAICMSGYFHPPYNQVPTEAQWKRVGAIIYRLEKELGKSFIVRGHNETSIDPTSCPGDVVGKHTSGYLKKIIDYANWLHENGEPTETPPVTCEDRIREAVDAVEASKNNQISKITDELNKTRKEVSEGLAEVGRLKEEVKKYITDLKLVQEMFQAKEDEIKNAQKIIDEKESRIIALEKKNAELAQPKDTRSIWQRILDFFNTPITS